MPAADPRGGDTITVTGIRARGLHGVLEDERVHGQEFVVDVHLQVDLGPASVSDDLGATVDYAQVAATVVHVIEGEPVDLIERLAGSVADQILGAYHLVERVWVSVHKPQAPVGVPFADVCVTVQRRRDAPVVIALGANLTDPARTVRAALRRLHRVRGLRGVRWSPVYRSTPVGGPPQPDYVNAVALARTSLTPGSLLTALHSIEDDAGRVREGRDGPRTLDLDLIQHGDPVADTDLRIQSAGLQLPHPRAHGRGFVLVPWLSIDPDAVLRVGGVPRRVSELVDALDTRDVVPLPEER